jgi:serine/threonine protein kinase
MPVFMDQLKAVFLAAMELKTAAERKAYLTAACGEDAALRRSVEALLRAHEQTDPLLDRPAAAHLEPASARAAVEDVLSFVAPPSRPDSLGRLGHYEILEVLGRGGFGIVFRALDETLQRVVAIKVLAPHLAATSPARKRFLREARSSAKVRHENVIHVYAVEEQPLPYLVMEFVPGETLQQRLDRIGPLDRAETVQIGRQIALGLAAAHATGLIHRDIKPENILIEEGAPSHIKITDFGLARAADDASMTQSGLVAGTPMFMSPEQASGESLDHRADLFSLGSVLYTMCAGHPPFRANSTLAVLKRVVEDTPRPIPEIIPEVSLWLCDLITQLHAKKPADRIGTAKEVADLLAEGRPKATQRPELRIGGLGFGV